jgi:hypothetical protein
MLKMLSCLNYLAILLAALLFNSNAFAKEREKCDFKLLQAALSKTLNLDLIPEKPDYDKPDSVISVNCKTLPNDANLLITAINFENETPSNAGSSSPSSQADSINFALALIDKKNKRIHRIYRSNLEQDALTRLDYGWTIDTAAYQLSPNVRAFAIKGGSTDYRCQHDGNSSGDFHIFADIGDKLQRLYEGGHITQMRKDAVYGSSCNYADQKWAEIHHTIDLVFSIAPTPSQGLRDIHVFAKVKSEWNIGQDYEKEFETKMRMDLTLPKDQRIRVGALRFNGATYVGDLTNKIDEIFAERSKISERFIKHAQKVFPSQ